MITMPVERPRVGRREWILLALLTLVAAALRAWSLHTAGIAQYDEGVYAFTGLGLTDSSQPFHTYPQQEKFAPPFYIAMVALSFLLGGASDQSAILLNIVLGTLMVPAIWFVARRWFGPAAGGAAAALLVFSPVHLTLSRSGLTDVAFALNFLIAVGTLAWALERGGNWRAVLAGLATGLAWNTKYHGWFAGVIAIGAVMAMHYRDRRSDETRERARILLVAGLVAIACYIPWTLYIKSQPGSVEGWSRYFATMLRLDWPGNFWRHVQQQAYLETVWSRSSVPLALVAAGIAHEGPADGRLRRILPLALLAVCSALLFGSFGTACLLTILTVPSLIRRGGIADWMLMTWLALWVVMAPAYHPYFRLLLPFCVATYLGTGHWLAEHLNAGTEPRGARLRLVATGAVAAVAVWMAASLVRPDVANPWQRGNALRAVATEMQAFIPSGARVTVVGEPALAFFLHRAGRPAFESPTPEDIDSLISDGYVITGVYTNRAAVLRRAIDGRRAEMDSITTLHFEPNDLRLLDDSRPAAARRYRVRPDSTFDLTLYRFRTNRTVKP